MRHAALLILVPFLAACDMHTKKPVDGDEKVNIKADESGQVTFDVPFASGKVKLPAGSLTGSDFDIDGVKMIPGGTITSFNLDAGDKGGTVSFGFKAPAPADEVRAYFADQFSKKGVEAAVVGDSVTGKTKDGEPFVVRVEPAAQGSQGTITIQSDH
jgi:hypothetical protein